MDEQLQKSLLSMVERMPAFPQSVIRVIELSSDINCPPKQLVKVIEHDPVMTMKMLKLVNSAYFGLRNSISSINHAVVYLGLNTIKNMALGIATMGMLKKFDSPWFNSADFLLHSLLVATVAGKIATILPKNGHDTTDFFTAGLLHDFGKIVLCQFMKNKFHQALDLAHSAEMALHEAEIKTIGADHAEVGAMLGAYWGLPAELSSCIREHHRLDGTQNLLTDFVFAANQVVKHLSIGHAGNRVVEPFPEHIQQLLAMSFDELLAKLGDLAEEQEKALLFMQL